jgi:hypothetical protein
MTVLNYVDARKQVVEPKDLKVFAETNTRGSWFAENEEAPASGSRGLRQQLSLYYWDENTGDNTGSVAASISASAVPGPIVGAGLPGLAMALGGLIAWRRRKMAAA